jgi:hypothetical protein
MREQVNGRIELFKTLALLTPALARHCTPTQLPLSEALHLESNALILGGCHVGAQFPVSHDSFLPQVHSSCRCDKFY